jgi:hypothetical protein
MEAKYLTSMKGWFSNNPNNLITEGRKLEGFCGVFNEFFSFEEDKFIIKRCQRMMLYLVSLGSKVIEVIRFKYPRFSYLWTLLSALIVFFFDPNQLLCNLMITLLFIFAINSPIFKKRMDPIMEKYFFREGLENPYSKINVKSPTELEDDFLLKKIYSEQLESTKSAMTKKAEKLKKMKGTYKIFKETYSSILHTLVVIADTLEQFKK